MLSRKNSLLPFFFTVYLFEAPGNKHYDTPTSGKTIIVWIIEIKHVGLWRLGDVYPTTYIEKKENSTLYIEQFRILKFPPVRRVYSTDVRHNMKQ
jgi:hypothetical protein